MPTKQAQPRKSAYITTDDLLCRLLTLTAREQETVLNDIALAIEAAEERVLEREASLYAARHAPPAGALTLNLPT